MCPATEAGIPGSDGCFYCRTDVLGDNFPPDGKVESSVDPKWKTRLVLLMMINDDVFFCLRVILIFPYISKKETDINDCPTLWEILV